MFFTTRSELPPLYWRYLRGWIVLGFPAFFALTAGFYLRDSRIINCPFWRSWPDAMQGAKHAAAPFTASDWQRCSAPATASHNGQFIVRESLLVAKPV
jgi:hypothetical protein